MNIILKSALTALALLGSSLAANSAVHAKPVLDLEQARQVLTTAIAYAHRVGAPGGAIAIVDDAGSLILLERLEGSFPAAPDVSIGKARTAAAFRKPTHALEDIVNKGRTTMITVAAVTDFTPLQGGVPLVIDGQVVGAIGVSGAASAQQDEEIAQAGSAALPGAATGN